MARTRKAALCIIVVLVCLVGVRAYNANRFHLEKRAGFLMDTFVTLYAVGPKEKVSRPLRLAMDRMREIDEKFNALNPKSPVYAFNHNNTPITDPEIVGLVAAALKVSELSEGAFDITTLPLSELWGFATKSPHVPSDSQIKETLKSVGYRHLILKDGRLEKDSPFVRIDFGGIAKGYAVGEAVKVLKSHGITSAIVDAGGHVYALGKRGNKFWKVGIRDPRSDGIIGYVEIEDLAVLGSGDYERFFIEDGERYAHIFDPKTGYPANKLQSVTIVYSDPMFADAVAKIFFVLGEEKGRKITASIPGLETIMVSQEGKISYSSRLKSSLTLVHREVTE